MKLAGRDAGKRGVIVDILDGDYVLIDGETRRRKVNVRHIELLKDSIDIKKNAVRSDVISAFKKLGIEIKDTKPKQKTERPKRVGTVKKTDAKDSTKTSEKKSRKK